VWVGLEAPERRKPGKLRSGKMRWQKLPVQLRFAMMSNFADYVSFYECAGFTKDLCSAVPKE
jgi:hypothetical protein